MKISILERDSLGIDVDMSEIDRLGEVTVYAATTVDNAVEHIGDADIIIANKLPLNEQTLEEAKNFSDYMGLKFPRFMMKHTLSSMNISTQNFQFVPYLDYKTYWTDKMLYDRYHLSNEEIEYIESMIRPME